MPEHTLEEYVEKELPLDQRLKGLTFFPGNKTRKLDRIVSSNIGFYEKLYFVYTLSDDEENALSYFSKNVLSTMSIGEIVSELLKSKLINTGAANYPSIDFSLVFSNIRYNLEEPFLMQISSNHGFWKELEVKSQEVIHEKYEEGLKHFVELITSMNESQPFIKGNPRLLFQTENEKEYVLKLFQWARHYKRIDIKKLPKELREFMELSEETKVERNSKKRTGRYVNAQLDGMASNHVTIFGMEYPEAQENNPILLTFRAKTLRSAAEKVSIAYTGLIAFYGEGIANKIFDMFPWLLDKVIFEREKRKEQTREYISAREELRKAISKITSGKINWNEEQEETKNQIEKERQKQWTQLSLDERARIWETLPSYVRSKIVAQSGNYGELIGKYNTWGSVVDVLGDLFAGTLVYLNEDYRPIVERKIIKPLFGKNLPFLLPSQNTKVDYIDNSPKYKAIHVDFILNNSELPPSQSVEMHITSVPQFLINDAVGEGSHRLRETQRVTDLLKIAPSVAPLIKIIEYTLGEKRGVRGKIITTGYLSPLKSCYQTFLKYLSEKGISVQN